MAYRIAVAGIWHLGEIYSACLAEIGHTVTGISEDSQVVQNLNRDIPPLAEPRLEEIISRNRTTGRLSYVGDYAVVKDADVFWLAFDTPVDEKDEVDLAPILDAVRKAAPHLKAGALVAVSSQIPVGTSEKIKSLLRELRPDASFEYAYSPENLRLGDAVKCFLEPGRVVVGADSEKALVTMKDVFAPLGAEMVTMSSASAEMAKHALNAFLATCISFTNDLADVAERTGADVEAVIRALKTDPRVGPKSFLFAGLGYSGGTLGRDIRALLNIAAEKKIELPIIRGVLEKNRSRNAVVRARLEPVLGNLAGKKLALFGVTYKAGTSTLRRSQPLEIEKELRAAGAELRLYDPLAIPEEVAAATPSFFSRDPLEAARDADAVLVMTPSPDYRNLDFAKLRTVVRNPVLFDTCNILPPVEEAIKAAGFTYLSIGRK